jgi:hypothetical protein
MATATKVKTKAKSTPTPHKVQPPITIMTTLYPRFGPPEHGIFMTKDDIERLTALTLREVEFVQD